MKQIFPIIPSSSGAGTMWLVVGVVALSMAIAIAAVVYVASSSKRVRFEVDRAGLKISGDLYGRLIPASSLKLDEARAIDLTVDLDYRLKWRTNGSSFSGYRSGWFRFSNGEKALVFVTDRTHVVYVPTTENYSVMLSVADPREFIGALKSAR
jgi:Bacterial PH domain